MADYWVCGPLAVIKDSVGKQRYYYHPALLPRDLPAEELDKLVHRGLIAKVDDPDTLSLVEPTPVERPAMTAPKEAWIEYVVYRGMPRTKAEQTTSKRDLIDAYPV